MVRITEELIRKRAEHNEGEIYSLEEISLHQQDIEKIENLDKWCRDLQILYLQNNLIGKIENVGRLKKLVYLNLALNNIELIENLENCESLTKLDLTVNFVGILTSVENLKGLIHFQELYLTGNPCTSFPGYRDFVIATLPNLTSLDGQEISKSERIIAEQNYCEKRFLILEEQERWKEKRELEKTDAAKRKEKRIQQNGDSKSSDGVLVDKNDEFWKEQVPFSPEARWETHEFMEEQKRKDKGNKSEDNKNKKPVRQMFNKEGKPFNINEGKFDFKFTDEEEDNCVKLDLALYRYLDTSLVDCDVQPNYVRVTVKGKILQLATPEEVQPDSSTAQRSQTTGHLIVTMPKVREVLKPVRKVVQKQNVKKEIPQKPACNNSKDNRPEVTVHTVTKEESNNHNEPFIDDPSVPPLE